MLPSLSPFKNGCQIPQISSTNNSQILCATPHCQTASYAVLWISKIVECIDWGTVPLRCRHLNWKKRRHQHALPVTEQNRRIPRAAWNVHRKGIEEPNQGGSWSKMPSQSLEYKIIPYRHIDVWIGGPQSSTWLSTVVEMAPYCASLCLIQSKEGSIQ